MYTQTHICMYVCLYTHNVCFNFASFLSTIYSRETDLIYVHFLHPMHLYINAYILHTNLNSIRVFKLCTKRTVLAYLNDFTVCICHIFPLLCFLSFFSFHSLSLFYLYLYPSLMRCTYKNTHTHTHTHKESEFAKSHRKLLFNASHIKWAKVLELCKCTADSIMHCVCEQYITANILFLFACTPHFRISYEM